MAKKPVEPTPLANRGDVVYLRSGSPKMTVIAITGDDAECVWITYGSNLPQKATFPRTALRVVEAYVPHPDDPQL